MRQRFVSPAMLAAQRLGMGLAAGTPEAIEASEAAGQADLADLARTANRLPIEGCEDRQAIMKKWGIEFRDDLDECFVNVLLPAGWEIRPTEHSMHSDLVDEKGKVRAGIFYKAAFYDRRANIHWLGRYRVQRIEDDGSRSAWGSFDAVEDATNAARENWAENQAVFAVHDIDAATDVTVFGLPEKKEDAS